MNVMLSSLPVTLSALWVFWLEFFPDKEKKSKKHKARNALAQEDEEEEVPGFKTEPESL